MTEVENLKGEAAEQYTKGFDEALNQVKFLYARLDVSSCGYFKEIWDGQLVDKPLPDTNIAEVERWVRQRLSRMWPTELLTARMWQMTLLLPLSFIFVILNNIFPFCIYFGYLFNTFISFPLVFMPCKISKLSSVTW